MSLNKQFQIFCYYLFGPENEGDILPVIDPADQMSATSSSDADVARQLNAAFLVLLAGTAHPQAESAEVLLRQSADSGELAQIARFYLEAKQQIEQEIGRVCSQDQDFAERLDSLAHFLRDNRQRKSSLAISEKIWSVFYPEAVGISSNRSAATERLRKKRTVTINRLNPTPITDPAREMIFTANVLLTLPSNPASSVTLNRNQSLRQKISKISEEPQRYWYDHPIHIGVKPENNELLYGLNGLAEALRFERKRGTIPSDSNVTCLLSVSVTHPGLHAIARPYIEDVVAATPVLNDIDLFVFTEDDTEQIVAEVLVPATGHFLDQQVRVSDLEMIGVDGEYGRHYSFLKAVTAFWNVFTHPHAKATFKIDLDQVFPQETLVEQTGASAFEHFMSPLWGARGTDSSGRPIEMGMIAGALVNEKDIRKSLFTPDVPFPERALTPDEFIFFSPLPQALSTEAEMMSRYHTTHLDGMNTCIQRVHVTGGTNGILIDSLRRHRPFTPSFIGRAEDQAYLLSALHHTGENLAYVHKDGLIMRHDKEAFAQEAIASAEIGRTVGDYLRILYFSSYADVLPIGRSEIKDTFDPFTGSFISKLPLTVAILRFSLKAADLFREQKSDKGLELVKTGSQRISDALKFTLGKDNPLKKQFDKERHGWNLYYNILDAVEQGIQNQDPFALQLQQKAQRILDQCLINPNKGAVRQKR